MGEPLKGVVSDWGRSKRPTQSHLLMAFRFRFLVSDVINESGFIPPDRGDEIPARPKILARKVSLLSQEKPGDHDRTLALEVAHHIRDRILRWYPQAHRHRIGPQISLNSIHFLIAAGS